MLPGYWPRELGPEDACWGPPAPACTHCSRPFSLFNRRHHCRRCGRLACDKCLPRVLGPRGRRVRACSLHLCAFPEGLDVPADRVCVEELFISSNDRLMAAARSGDLPLVKYLVEEEGVPPHWGHPFTQQIAFHAACQAGHLEVAQFLAQQESSSDADTLSLLSSEDQDGQSAVWLAAESGHAHVVEWLVNELHLPFNSYDHQGVDPAYAALQKGHLRIARFLYTKNNVTPLWMACALEDNEDAVIAVCDRFPEQAALCDSFEGNSPVWMCVRGKKRRKRIKTKIA
jgi:hypothetical protein